MFIVYVSILVLSVLVLAAWYFGLLDAIAERFSRGGRDAPDDLGRTGRRRLVIGRETHMHDPDTPTTDEELYLHHLHAMEEGADRSVCGTDVVAVESIHDDTMWPPAHSTACERCEEILADEEREQRRRERMSPAERRAEST